MQPSWLPAASLQCHAVLARSVTYLPEPHRTASRLPAQELNGGGPVFPQSGKSGWDPAWGVTAPGFPWVEGTYMKWGRWLQEYELPITSPGCPFFGARASCEETHLKSKVWWSAGEAQAGSYEEMFLSFF